VLQQHAKKKSAVDRFWDRFTDQAQKNGVKQPALRWYVCHAEAYLKAFPDKRLANHDVSDITGYLEWLGKLDSISDWQFMQHVDAIQNLLVTAGAAVASEIDWGFWRDSARTLPEQHPTIARETRQPSTQSSANLGVRVPEKSSMRWCFCIGRS